ncbi:hypothetical protein ACVWZ3_000295 [Bradyrhizobium sp. i1.3.6]
MSTTFDPRVEADDLTGTIATRTASEAAGLVKPVAQCLRPVIFPATGLLRLEKQAARFGPSGYHAEGWPF